MPEGFVDVCCVRMQSFWDGGTSEWTKCFANDKESVLLDEMIYRRRTGFISKGGFAFARVCSIGDKRALSGKGLLYGKESGLLAKSVFSQETKRCSIGKESVLVVSADRRFDCKTGFR